VRFPWARLLFLGTGLGGGQKGCLQRAATCADSGQETDCTYSRHDLHRSHASNEQTNPPPPPPPQSGYTRRLNGIVVRHRVIAVIPELLCVLGVIKVWWNFSGGTFSVAILANGGEDTLIPPGGTFAVELAAANLALQAQPQIFFVVRSVKSHLVAAYRYRLSPLPVAAQPTATSLPLSLSSLYSV